MIVPSSVRVFAHVVAGRTPDEVLGTVVRSLEAVPGVTVVESSATPSEAGAVDVTVRWSHDHLLDTLDNRILEATGHAIWDAANTRP